MRHKDCDWNLHCPGKDPATGCTHDLASVQANLLMDIRDELATLRRIFQCRNFLEIPGVLQAIRQNTTKPRRKKPARLRRAA